jgi:DNA-binding NarL/FixJ family response regulator
VTRAIPVTGTLSPRQLEIIRLIANGQSDKEIAKRLGISVTTVRTHLQRLYRDCSLRNRAEAVGLLWRMTMLSNSPRAPVVTNDVISVEDSL